MPEIIVGKGHGARFDIERQLATDVGVGGHAVGRRVAKMRARDDDRRPHVGRNVARIVEPQKAVDLDVVVVGAILMPVHVPGTRLLTVPVAMAVDPIVMPQQAGQRTHDSRVR